MDTLLANMQLTKFEMWTIM